MMYFLIAFIICVLITLLGSAALTVLAGGLETHEGVGWAVIGASSLAIYLGIISSIVFDRFDRRFVVSGSIFRKSDLVIAATVAPLVFLVVYPLMQGTQDTIIQVLVAYQNGFLFQNITSRIRGKEGA